MANALVSMYGKASVLHHALQLFDEIPHPDVVSWNAAVSSCFHGGDCGRARELFEMMLWRDEVSWATMVSGYVRHGFFYEGLCVFRRMIREASESDGGTGMLKLLPNSNTVVSVISACVKLRDLSCGEQIHGYIRKINSSVERDVFVGSALVDFYGKCGCVLLARHVFDYMVEKCVVAWSTLISVYVNIESHLNGIEVFRAMMCDGVEPNYFTLTMLMDACGTMMNLQLGKELHCFAIRKMAGSDLYVSTSLINMYSRCSLIEYAGRVFKKTKKIVGCNGISLWNSMMVGYLENEHVDGALSVLRSVTRLVDCKPNCITMAIVLPMFSQSTSLLSGKEMHCYAIKNGLDGQVQVGNCLVNLYSKCGKIKWARFQFDRMEERNCVSWATMINGYGIHGNGEGAINLFKALMEKGGPMPDNAIFVALLSACSRAGLVEEGLKHFSLMKNVFGLQPTEETYGCVVDLLARSGHISQAKEFIDSIPYKPSLSMWGALLGSCRIHGNVNEAKVVAKKLFKIKQDESGFQALLSNIYAESGKPEDAASLRKGMGMLRLKKKQGCSWLESKAWSNWLYYGKSYEAFDTGTVSNMH